MDTQCNAGFSNLVCADPHQLQLAVADVSRALDEVLRKNGIHAMLHLRRAEELLAPAAQPENSRNRTTGPRLTAWQRRRVLDHIETSLAKPLRNRELADVLGYSEFHFSVAFRNTLGHSPHEYLIRRRIERAQQLMLSSDMPLCQISAECGLADQAHLSRLFRRVVGETPAAWRRQHSDMTLEPLTGDSK